MPPLRPPGYSTVIPFLAVGGMESALAFYEAVFGFRRTNLNEQGGKLVHAEMECGGEVVLMLAPDGLHSSLNGSPASRGTVALSETLVFVANADAAHDEAVRRGGKSLHAPNDVPWGERHAIIQDPEGYRWLLSQNRGT